MLKIAAVTGSINIPEIISPTTTRDYSTLLTFYSTKLQQPPLIFNIQTLAFNYRLRYISVLHIHFLFYQVF